MAVGNGVVEQSCSNEPGRVADVGHEDGPYLISDLAESFEIPIARIGTGSGNDQFRAGFMSFGFHLLHINAPALAINTVKDRVI